MITLKYSHFYGTIKQIKGSHCVEDIKADRVISLYKLFSLLSERGKSMKKVLLLILCLALLTVNFTACNGSEDKDATVTVTDMLGETVEVKKNPTKVACVSRTTYDLLIAFGLGDYIDGAYKTIYDNEWVATMYSGSADEYRYDYEESYETFISRGVELVFAPEKYIANGLKEHGVTALNVSLYGNPTYDEYVYFFADLVTQIWDSPEVVAKVAAWKTKVGGTIKEIQDTLNANNVQTQSLYYVRGDKNKGIGYTDTAAAFTEYAYRQLGFNFISKEFETNKPSAEEICAKNPDVIVIGGIYQNTLKDTLYASEVYVNLDAVKNNKVYTIPVGFTMFEQISAMTPIFFCDMANKLYPDLFNYDVETMIKESVKEYFGTELTDQQINYILSGKAPDGGNLAQ